ncbi:hypothetical protein FTO70_06570 [Methanosarcina sp. KYL-1]|uniref:7-cyano-7-deazaguanine synthase n=1 Tax=Methanosarcina sp. KYL-1 TaxID=2602068 RepID=UPI002100712F|nr:7-cyano-7-deazaguanine synthase [Methanosarcina sp. KYL-1]MCQ1535359.1 hypothetical protein [Methanosarcina sp. KYL-1]
MNMSTRSENLAYFEFYTADGKVTSIKTHQFNETFLYELDPSCRTSKFDLYNIAIAFFELERQLILKKKVVKIVIPITSSTFNRIDQKNVLKILKSISLFIFNKNIIFELNPCLNVNYQSNMIETDQKYDSICLFSGGADSFVGVLNAKKRKDKVLSLFIWHKSSKKLCSYIKTLKTELLDQEKISFEKVNVPDQIKYGYSQSRGLLYLICGGIYASMYKSNNLILSECGVTIYQPRFGELDKTTYTSHPEIQAYSRELIKEFLGLEINIETPFENNTKSEMFAMASRKELLKNTHSCITSMYGKNIGTCYGCMIRRIGFIVADIEDCDYLHDIFTLEDDSFLEYARTYGERRVNDFLELMKFSFDVLVNYQKMDYRKKEKIETYGKYDLFRRFSLDTFAAIYILYEEKNVTLNPRIKNAYLDAIKYISKKEIEDRISYVRNLK